jgi:hypothetical protein
MAFGRTWWGARPLVLGVGLTVVSVAVLLVAGASPALAGAWWRLSSRAAPSSLPPGGTAIIVVSATNVGDGGINATTSPVTIKDTLPPNLEAIKITGKPVLRETVASQMTCHRETLTCSTQPETFPAFERLEVNIEVNVKPGATTGEENQVEVQGGEQAGGSGVVVSRAAVSHPLLVSGEPTMFGVEQDGYGVTPEEEGGGIDRQAGSHPFQLTTALNLDQTAELIPPEGGATEAGLIGTAPALPRRLSFNLPPGLIGDPRAVPACPTVDFTAIGSGDVNACKPESVIGVAVVSINLPDPTFHNVTRPVPLFNLVPASGEPARFGFEVLHVPVVLDTSLRSGGDYGVSVSVNESPESAQLLSSEVTIWGAPAQASHDQSRGWGCLVEGASVGRTVPCEPFSQHSPNAFLTLPTSCTGSLGTTVEGESWPIQALAGEPGRVLSLEGGSTKAELAGFEGCDALSFSPSVALESTEHAASTPTGLSVRVRVPQQGTLQAGQLAEADVKDTGVTLPEGMQLNPSAAGGLEACSEQLVGFEGQPEDDPLSPGAAQPLRFSSELARCPPASKVGTVRIRTPLLEHELHGSVYLATPAPVGEAGQNPFDSLLALYLVAEEPVAGIRVKLAGESRLNGETGQVSTSFQDTPQVPFEELTFELSGGPRASLSTPPLCGTPSLAATFTPWLAEGVPSVTLSSGGEERLNITSGIGGGACSNQAPFAPGVVGGSGTAQAGAFTSFSLAVTRPDGDQPLTGAAVQLPSGAAAMLSSVTPCPEPQAALGTCGRESEIGDATATSGVGPDPFTVTGGRVYITGPYQGAPFGLSIVTPAIAGPFDLGNVVVRSSINVDPHTALVTITSAIPTMVQGVGRPASGVPLQLRQINVSIDRPNFEFNPTNCTPASITATLTGEQGASATVSSPFQVAECQRLPFKPGVTAATRGKTSKADGASLALTFRSHAGEAHIAKTILTIPATLPARLTTIQKACLARVFEANPAACPEGSDIGTAVVHTPVLKNPVEGPIYLVSHGNAAWPDAELVLQSEGVTVILDGQTAIKKGVTTSSFLSVPDVPFETVQVTLPEGPHSALTTNLPLKDHYDLCGQHLAIPTQLTGQNGTLDNQSLEVTVQGCSAVKASKTRKLTRTQQLALALKACRTRHKHSRATRMICERHSRRRYGAKQAARKRSHTSARTSAG